MFYRGLWETLSPEKTIATISPPHVISIPVTVIFALSNSSQMLFYIHRKPSNIKIITNAQAVEIGGVALFFIARLPCPKNNLSIFINMH